MSTENSDRIVVDGRNTETGRPVIFITDLTAGGRPASRRPAFSASAQRLSGSTPTTEAEPVRDLRAAVRARLAAAAEARNRGGASAQASHAAPRTEAQATHITIIPNPAASGEHDAHMALVRDEINDGRKDFYFPIPGSTEKIRVNQEEASTMQEAAIIWVQRLAALRQRQSPANTSGS